MRKFLILFLIGFVAQTALAVDIIYIPQVREPESFLHKVLRCKWRISCYQTPFGVSITTINSTDLISSLPTSLNANFSALNQKMESATTSVASITTLSNLVTVGALSSGSLASGFTAVTVPLGGTGSTTLSLNQLLLGNTTSGLKVVSGYGITGQFLTSQGNGAAPAWTTSSVDLGIAYAWTGLHTFSAGLTSGTSTIGSLHATSTLLVGGTANITGSVNIGGTATTTTNGNLEVNQNLIVQKSVVADTLRVLNGSKGMASGVQIVSDQNVGCSGTSGDICDISVSCPAGTSATGGGYNTLDTVSTRHFTTIMNRIATTSPSGWRTIIRVDTTVGSSFGLNVNVICL